MVRGKDEDEKWAKYFTSLEDLEDISVLGITDYWSLDGYKKVLEYKNQGGLENFELTLTWADDTKSELNSSSENNDFQSSHKITYIPQSYLNYIAERRKETVDKIIEKVLLQNIETKAAYEVFKKDKQKEELSLDIKIAELFSIYEQGKTIKEEAKIIGNKEGIEKFIQKLSSEIKDISSKFGFTNKEITEKEKLENERLDKEQRIERFKTDKIKITSLKEGLKQKIDFTDLYDEISQLSELSENIITEDTQKNINQFIDNLETKYQDYLYIIPAKIKILDGELNNLNKTLEPFSSLKLNQNIR